MDWFEGISDFIYLAHKSLGPLIYIPIVFLGILVLVPISKLMDILKIPGKYQGWLIVAIIITALIAYGIIMSKYPLLDWMLNDDF